MLERQYVVASFLHKLWSMLEDPANATIISWSDDGNSFIVHDQSRFSMEILPKFYKHNNMASFIRQLNMYGFSKISHDPSHNALHSVKNAESTSVEFHHPQFMRGQPDMVASIKRKTTVGNHVVPAQQQQLTQQIQSPNLQNDPMAIRVLSEVQQLHKKNDSFNNQLEQLRHENEVLWREMATLRQKCHNQQTIISKVVNFLVSVIGGNGSSGINAVGSGSKRSYPMIEADRSRPNTAQGTGGLLDSSPAKVSKLFSNNNTTGGVTIQEIIDDEASRSEPISLGPVTLISDPYETSLPAEDLSAIGYPEHNVTEPPVKVVPLPTVGLASQAGPADGKSTPSTSSPQDNYEHLPGLSFNGEELNNHLDNMQIDLDQLRTNLRTYFSQNSPEGEPSLTAQFNEDFLSDLFSTEQPITELESPLPSPTLATPISALQDDDVHQQKSNATSHQLVKYLPPNYYLVSGSADPLLLQPSSSNTPMNSSQPANVTTPALKNTTGHFQKQI